MQQFNKIGISFLYFFDEARALIAALIVSRQRMQTKERNMNFWVLRWIFGNVRVFWTKRILNVFIMLCYQLHFRKIPLFWRCLGSILELYQSCQFSPGPTACQHTSWCKRDGDNAPQIIHQSNPDALCISKGLNRLHDSFSHNEWESLRGQWQKMPR